MTVSGSHTVAMRFPTDAALCSAPYLREPVLRLAREYAPLSSAVRVLDVGCGNGYWSRLFSEERCDVTGVDPSETGIAIARQSCPSARFEQLEASADLIEKLGVAPFDLVVSTEVVEHLYDPSQFAAGCFRALRPGGRLIVSTPYHGRLKNIMLAATGRHDLHHEALRVGGHIKFFSRDTLASLLREAGFVNLRFEGAGRVPRLWKSMLYSAQHPAA